MPLWLADLIHRVCKQICAIILTLPLFVKVLEIACLIIKRLSTGETDKKTRREE